MPLVWWAAVRSEEAGVSAMMVNGVEFGALEGTVAGCSVTRPSHGHWQEGAFVSWLGAWSPGLPLAEGVGHTCWK